MKNDVTLLLAKNTTSCSLISPTSNFNLQFYSNYLQYTFHFPSEGSILPGVRCWQCRSLHIKPPSLLLTESAEKKNIFRTQTQPSWSIWGCFVLVLYAESVSRNGYLCLEITKGVLLISSSICTLEKNPFPMSCIPP